MRTCACTCALHVYVHVHVHACVYVHVCVCAHVCAQGLPGREGGGGAGGCSQRHSQGDVKTGVGGSVKGEQDPWQPGPEGVLEGPAVSNLLALP